jgi:hypothetical protein
MSILITLLTVYILGGITLLPLLLLVALPFLSKPVTGNLTKREDGTGQMGVEHDTSASRGGLPAQAILQEPDVAAGYFTVCREYNLAGAKLGIQEKKTLWNAENSSDPPSVYQTMYRNLFDRNKAQPAPKDGHHTPPKPPRRAPNSFFIVLR